MQNIDQTLIRFGQWEAVREATLSLVQSLSGVLPDDSVVGVRCELGAERLEAAVQVLWFAVARARPPLRDVEAAVLGRLLDCFDVDSAPLDRFDRVQQRSPSFEIGPTPEGLDLRSLDDAVRARAPYADAIWRSWRVPMRGAPWPAPRPVYTIQGGSTSSQTLLRACYGPPAPFRAPSDPLVEIYRFLEEPTGDLHVRTSRHAVLLEGDPADWAPVPDAVPVPAEGWPLAMYRLLQSVQDLLPDGVGERLRRQLIDPERLSYVPPTVKDLVSSSRLPFTDDELRLLDGCLIAAGGMATCGLRGLAPPGGRVLPFRFAPAGEEPTGADVDDDLELLAEAVPGVEAIWRARRRPVGEPAWHGDRLLYVVEVADLDTMDEVFEILYAPVAMESDDPLSSELSSRLFSESQLFSESLSPEEPLVDVVLRGAALPPVLREVRATHDAGESAPTRTQLAQRLHVLTQSLADLLDDGPLADVRGTLVAGDLTGAGRRLATAAGTTRRPFNLWEGLELVEVMHGLGLDLDDPSQGRPFEEVPRTPDLVLSRDAPADEVATRAADADVLARLTGLDGVRGVWRAWRLAVRAVPTAPRRPLYLIEVAGWADVPALTARFYGSGVPTPVRSGPVVEVYVTGEPIPPLLGRIRDEGLRVRVGVPVPDFRYASPLGAGVPPLDVPRFSDRDVPLLQQVLMAEYLDSGYEIARLEPAGDDVMVPRRRGVVPGGLRTDGTWIWSEATSYYLKRYAVRPPQDLLDHLATRTALPPRPPDVVCELAVEWLQEQGVLS